MQISFYKASSAALLLLVLLPFQSFGILGTHFPPPNDIFVCEVRYQVSPEQTYKCSGTFISHNLFLTAGHCDKGRESLPTSIHCPYFGSLPVVGRSIPPENANAPDYFNTYDVAVLKIPFSIELNFPRIAQTKSEIRSLLQKNQGCFAMGYGHTGSKTSLKSVDSAEVSFPSIIGLDLLSSSSWTAAFWRSIYTFGKTDQQDRGNPWMVLKSAKVTPGDSGGPLFCLNEKREPILIATHSLSAMHPLSLLVSENIDWIKSQIAAEK